MSLRALSGTLCLVFAASVGAQGNGRGAPPRLRGDVPLLLFRAIRAQPTLKYTGTYIVEFRQSSPPVRHQELITRDGSQYRIDFPTDSQFAGQVIVEDSHVRLHYHPIANEIIQQPPRHGESWEKVANLATDPKFHLSTAEGQVVAGLKTEQLVVSDKFGNIIQRLFIEPNSGVILKRQIFDLVGTQAGFFEFTQIDLAPKIDPTAFVIKRKNAAVITPETQLQRVCKRQGFVYRVINPSSGFLLESAIGRKFAGIQGIVETYVNGRIRLWVYILKSPVDPMRLRQQARKSEHFYSWHSGEETIVLIGNLPEKSLENLAGAMSVGTPPPPAKL